MKAILSILIVAALFGGLSSCTKSEMQNIKPSVSGMNGTAKLATTNLYAYSLKPEILDVYLDRQIFSLGVRKFTGPAAKELVAQTPIVHYLFLYDAKQMLELDGKKFLNVTDAINPVNSEETVWKEYIIRFGRGASIQQFSSAQDLMAAVNGGHGQITLVQTGSVYQGKIFMLTARPGGFVTKE